MSIATPSTSCTSSNFTINSVSDAASLANCSTLLGDVIISHSDPLIEDIDISGPANINGDLIMENTLRTYSLSSTSLTSITGTLALTNVDSINLTMPALTRVGSIHFQSVTFESLDFGNGITSVENVFIDDSSRRSIDILGMTSVDGLTLTNNMWHNQLEVSLPVRDIISAFMVESD